MQVKDFNEKARWSFSKENPTSLVTIIENSISNLILDEESKENSEESQFNSNPVVYALRSECLYLIYKWNLVKNLAQSKYKLVEGGQNELEKQYLPMDIFYSSDINEQWNDSAPKEKSGADRLSQDPDGNRMIMIRDGQIQMRIGGNGE